MSPLVHGLRPCTIVYPYQPIQPVASVTTTPVISSIVVSHSAQAGPSTPNPQVSGLRTSSSQIGVQKPSVSRISQPQASLPLS